MTDEEKLAYKKSIQKQIRNGSIPRFMFAKDKDGKMERKIHRGKKKLTWRLVGTLAELTKD